MVTVPNFSRINADPAYGFIANGWLGTVRRIPDLGSGCEKMQDRIRMCLRAVWIRSLACILALCSIFSFNSYMFCQVKPSTYVVNITVITNLFPAMYLSWRGSVAGSPV